MLSKRDKRYIALALHESTRSDYDRVHIGAIIISGNYMVSRSCNKKRTHPRQRAYNRSTGRECATSSLHAEMGALVASGRRDLNGCDIFVARYNRAGALAQCRPCSACWAALKDSGISRVVYTTEVGIKEEWV